MPVPLTYGLEKEKEEYPVGKRKKGPGYFGELQRPDGMISTELSIGVNIDGKEIEIPSLVPTLTKDEIDYLLKGNKPTKQIADKAVEHARKRIKEGKDPFAQLKEKEKTGLPLDYELDEEVSKGVPLDYGLKEEKKPTQIEFPTRDWTTKYPNLYGVFGAAQSLVPYLKYIDPSERERFNQLSTQEATKELLWQNFEAVAILGAGPITKGVGTITAPLIAKYLPKTYKALKLLKTPITRIPEVYRKPAKEVAEEYLSEGLTVAQRIGQYKTLNKGKHPSKETIAQWWKQQPKYKPKTDADKVKAMYDATDIELKELDKKSIRHVYQTLKRTTIDTSGNIKKALIAKGGKAGKEAVIRHDLIKGASTKTERIVTEASSRIYADLSKAEEKTLNRIIQSRRTLAIEDYKPGIKHPGGLVKEHAEFLDDIPKEISLNLNKRADLYFAEMRNQLAQLRQAGLITEDSYQALLKSGDYSPRNFIQHIDPERVSYDTFGRKISIPDSGIKALEEGSEQVLQNNSHLLLTQVVGRTQARIFRNEANKALYQLATDIPDNGIVNLAKVAKSTKVGKPIYQAPPTGYEKISVVVDGIHKEMLMPSKIAKEWLVNDPAMNTQLANIVGWLSGAKILRPMATGLNPEFALTNFPRDIVHAWLTTHEYSSFTPKWLLQAGKDFAKTASAAFRRKGAYIDYIDGGGGMQFLTHQGRVTGKSTGAIAQLQKVLGYLGETSEIWTRLALRERALINGKSAQEATWIARTYLDFGQGGNFIKAIDTAIPYLNASVQATRGLVRAAAEKPGEFVWKTAQLGTLTTGLYLANKYTNPECWDSVSDRDKVNNFIITTPLTYKDKNGETRHLYFRIAKDQSQRLISTLFENLTAKYLGENINIEQITQAAQDLIPIIPTQAIPPTMDAMLGYYSNKDFWTNEDIWKRAKVKPSEEYTRYTHPALVKFGKLTKLSPERTEYVLQEFFTRGNIYSTLVSGGLRQVMNKLPGDVKEDTTKEMLASMPFVRKMLRSTSPYTKYQQDIEKVRLEEATRRFKQTRDLDALSETYYLEKNPTIRNQIDNYIKSQPVQERERLRKRFRGHEKLYNIPNKRWWLNLMELSPEARATVYWTKWQSVELEEQEQMELQRKRLSGISSERFMIKLNQLKRK